MTASIFQTKGLEWVQEYRLRNFPGPFDVPDITGNMDEKSGKKANNVNVTVKIIHKEAPQPSVIGSTIVSE